VLHDPRDQADERRVLHVAEPEVLGAREIVELVAEVAVTGRRQQREDEGGCGNAEGNRVVGEPAVT
jgi:hypothetical protein